jgi:uncharacterized protein YceH (UPF0502 family)
VQALAEQYTSAPSSGGGNAALEARVQALETTVAALQEQLAELRAQLGG